MKRYPRHKTHCIVVFFKMFSVVIIVDLDLQTQTLCLSVRGNVGVESMAVRWDSV